MRKPFRIALWVGGGLVAGVLLALVALYLAARHVPAAYRRALEADPAAEAKASDEMLRKATDLVSTVKTFDRWQARFTAEEINGWFAVGMKKHPGLLPPEFSDPRVTIAPDEVRVYCRFERGGVESVLSLSVDAYLAEPNVVALRIRRARAGALPLPLDEVLDQFSKQAARHQLRVQWKQSGGDPVALVTLDIRERETGRRVRIEALELREGEVYASGTSEK